MSGGVVRVKTSQPHNYRVISGDESLQTGYKQDTKLGFIVKAILALAHSLHHMQVELCGDTGRGVCQDMKPFDGKLYRVTYN